MTHIYIVFLLKIITEFILGLLIWPFNRLLKIPYHETPQVYCLDTEFNRKMIDRLPINKFSCPAWLTGPFIQTIVSCFISSEEPKFRREFVEFPDGVELAIDIKEHTDTPLNTPLVVICHGLVGGTKDPSVNMYANLIVNQLKWRCILYIRRGHDGTSIAPKSMKDTGKVPDNLSSDFKLFPKHCDLEDMEFICEYVYKKYPDAPKFLAGLSVGSNLTVKYLALCNHQFLGGISLCNGLHLTKLANDLDKEQIALSNMLTERYKSMIRNNMSEIQQLASKIGVKVDFNKILASKNIRSFDENILPLIGYKNGELDKYYMDNSCFYDFEKIKVPLLCMTAMDDPIISRKIPIYSIEGAKNNKNIISIITERGGHLGWMTNLYKSWSCDIFAAFFQSILCSKQE